MAIPWTVRPHGPLEQLTDSLWHLEGEVPTMAIGRHMVVARRADGSLVVHNAIACDEQVMAQLDALGPVAYVIAPNAFHRIDGGRYAERYPAAKILTPKPAMARVRQRMRVDGDVLELPADETLRAMPLPGVVGEAMLLHTDQDGHVTAIFNDILFNLPDTVPGVSGLIMRLLGSVGGAKVTRVAKWGLVKDRAALRARFLELSANEMLVRVVPGHGALISGEPCGPAQDAMERAATSLL